MKTILNQLPFSSADTTAEVPDGQVVVRQFQIIVWVSLSIQDVLSLPPETPRFPAILDIGLNHNFSIRQSHLEAWAGLTFANLPFRREAYLGQTLVPLADLNVWLYRNRKGERDDLLGKPFPLVLREGIAVYPRGVPNPARLPTLGLRALVRNKLRLVMDGDKQIVSLTQR